MKSSMAFIKENVMVLALTSAIGTMGWLCHYVVSNTDQAIKGNQDAILALSKQTAHNTGWISAQDSKNVAEDSSITANECQP